MTISDKPITGLVSIGNSIVFGTLLLFLLLLPLFFDRFQIFPSRQSTLAGQPDIKESSSAFKLDSSCSQNPARIVKANGDQTQAKIAYNSTNKQYMVVWEDDRQGDNDIFRLILEEGCPYADGSNLASITTEAGIDQTLPDVVYNPDLNEYFVIWHDAKKGVKGQRISAAGQAQSDVTTFFSNNDLPSRVFTHSVVTYDLSQQKYLVVSERIMGDDHTTRVAMVTPDTLVSDYMDVPPTNRDRRPKDITHSAAGKNLLVWEDLESVDLDVYAKEVNTDPTEIPISGAANNDQQHPTLAFSPICSQFLIAWEDARNGSKNNIYGQYLSETLVFPNQPVMQIVASVTQTQSNPSVAASTIDGEYLVAWQAKNDGESYNNIYARRLDCVGNPVAGQGVIQLSNVPKDQTSPSAAYLTREGKYLVVWSEESPDLGLDIYAQLVDTEIDPAPRVVETSPQSGEVDVPVTTSITVRFSEPMSPATVSLVPLFNATPTWSDNDKVVTFQLDSILSTSQMYTLHVEGEDKTGNALIMENNKNPWSFTTLSTLTTYFPLITKCYPFRELENGDFETSDLSAWTKQEVNGHLANVICTDDTFGYSDFASNSCVVRLGNPGWGSGSLQIPTSPDIPNGHASVSQKISVPCTGDPVLKFDYYFITYDYQDFNGIPRDALEVSLFPEATPVAVIGFPGVSGPPPNVKRSLSHLSQPVQIPLANFRGQTLDLTFSLWTREHNPVQVDQGLGIRNSWAYIDNVRIE